MKMNGYFVGQRNAVNATIMKLLSHTLVDLIKK